VIAAARLRGGTADSGRGAARFAAGAIGAARATGCGGTLIVRAGPACYCAALCGAVRRAAWHGREQPARGASRLCLGLRAALQPSLTTAILSSRPHTL
jgi:hypothetical protein